MAKICRSRFESIGFLIGYSKLSLLSPPYPCSLAAFTSLSLFVSRIHESIFSSSRHISVSLHYATEAAPLFFLFSPRFYLLLLINSSAVPYLLLLINSSAVHYLFFVMNSSAIYSSVANHTLSLLCLSFTRSSLSTPPYISEALPSTHGRCSHHVKGKSYNTYTQFKQKGINAKHKIQYS